MVWIVHRRCDVLLASFRVADPFFIELFSFFMGEAQRALDCLKMPLTCGLSCSQKTFVLWGWLVILLLTGKAQRVWGLWKNMFMPCSRAATQLSSTFDQWFEVLTEHFCALFQGSYSAVLYLGPMVWGADRTFLWFVPGRLLSCPLPWKPWGVAAREAEVQLQRRAAVGSQLVFSESRCFDWPGWYLWSVI